MEERENTNTEKNEKKITKAKVNKERDEIQVTVSLECDSQLQKILETINHEFDFHRVTRKQLLNYIVSKASIKFDEQDVTEIRKRSLSDMALWDRLNREIRETGVVPDALKEFLWKSSNLTKSPKRFKKSGQTRYSNAIQEGEVTSES